MTWVKDFKHGIGTFQQQAIDIDHSWRSLIVPRELTVWVTAVKDGILQARDKIFALAGVDLSQVKQVLEL